MNGGAVPEAIWARGWFGRGAVRFRGVWPAGSDRPRADPRARGAADSGRACPCAHRHRARPRSPAGRVVTCTGRPAGESSVIRSGRRSGRRWDGRSRRRVSCRRSAISGDLAGIVDRDLPAQRRGETAPAPGGRASASGPSRAARAAAGSRSTRFHCSAVRDAREVGQQPVLEPRPSALRPDMSGSAAPAPRSRFDPRREAARRIGQAAGRDRAPRPAWPGRALSAGASGQIRSSSTRAPSISCWRAMTRRSRRDQSQTVAPGDRGRRRGRAARPR